MAKGELREDLFFGLKVAVCIGIVVVVLTNFGGIYRFADESGWIPHSRRATVVFPSSGWEPGEYKDCTIIHLTTPDVIYVNCAVDLASKDGTPREMDIKLWGVVSLKVSIFKCQRSTDTMDCHIRRMNIEDR